MNPVQVIEKAKSLGVSLHLTDKHLIRFKGDSKSIDEVMPLLQAHKVQLIQWLEFSGLYDYLAPLSEWTGADYQEWCKDLAEQPELTMECLRALKHSWGRGGYGCLTLADWLSRETKNKLRLDLSKWATNLSQMSN